MYEPITTELVREFGGRYLLQALIPAGATQFQITTCSTLLQLTDDAGCFKGLCSLLLPADILDLPWPIREITSKPGLELFRSTGICQLKGRAGLEVSSNILPEGATQFLIDCKNKIIEFRDDQDVRLGFYDLTITSRMGFHPF
ncbi:MAG: hypothetical protein COB66_05340 [Coxiella sp. (in: Bacteria)]|nr:MAG: hypothetical protein COB66_05340 [Coxiella sp. (in: g-proteobacteria)]